MHDYTAVAMARKAGMNCRPLTVPATAGGLCTVPIFVLGKCVPWGLPWGCRVYTALPRIPNRCPKWSCRGKRKRKFILKTRKDIFFYSSSPGQPRCRRRRCRYCPSSAAATLFVLALVLRQKARAEIGNLFFEQKW